MSVIGALRPPKNTRHREKFMGAACCVSLADEFPVAEARRVPRFPPDVSIDEPTGPFIDPARRKSIREAAQHYAMTYLATADHRRNSLPARSTEHDAVDVQRLPSLSDVLSQFSLDSSSSLHPPEVQEMSPEEEDPTTFPIPFIFRSHPHAHRRPLYSTTEMNMHSLCPFQPLPFIKHTHSQ